MRVLLTIALAVGSFAGQATVEKSTDDYCKAFANFQTSELRKFYSDNTEITFDSELPFGGNFKGENISLFYTRMPATMEVISPWEKSVLAVDESMGTSMCLTRGDVMYKRTQENAPMKLIHVLEWDQETGTILKHHIMDQSIEETTEAYRTEAEKKLWNLLWQFFQSPYEDVVDPSSPLWDLVSDDIKLKLNIHPEDILSETEFEGKEDAVQGIEEVLAMKLNSPLYKMKMKQDLGNVLKILSATDTEVYASYHDGDAIVHYTFEEGPKGKLIAEEVLLDSALAPWQVYPFPMPMKVDGEDDIEYHWKTEKSDKKSWKTDDDEDDYGKKSWKTDDDDYMRKKLADDDDDGDEKTWSGEISWKADDDDDDGEYMKTFRKSGKKTEDDDDDGEYMKTFRKSGKKSWKTDDDEDDGEYMRKRLADDDNDGDEKTWSGDISWKADEEDDEDGGKRRSSPKRTPWTLTGDDDDGDDNKYGRKSKKSRTWQVDEEDDSDYKRKSKFAKGTWSGDISWKADDDNDDGKYTRKTVRPKMSKFPLSKDAVP